MHKKIVIIVLFLASLLKAQDQNSNVKNQMNFDKMTLISVTIGGSFIVTGTFPSTTTERVDQFVTRLYNEARNAALNVARDEVSQAKVVEQITKYSKRDITLKRLSGEVLKLDLEKFRLTGDFKYNPYLKNDDVLIFAEGAIDRNYFIVEGAVNLPGKYQFVQGDKLSDALLLARGINPAYDNVNSVEIYRLDKTGNSEEIIKAKISDAVELKPADRIKVVFDENFKKDYKVLVLGEVKNPGFVFIKKNQTTVKELIERAGGFTQNAWLENSELLRGGNSQQLLRMQYIKEQYEKNPEFKLTKFDSKFNYQNMDAMIMARSNNLTVEDTLAFSLDNMLRLYYSPGLVDFAKINDQNSKEGSFLVKEGDVVLIPEKQNLVYLFGQVQTPGYVAYEEGKNYKHYIEKAGGSTEIATGEVKVIKSKAKAWVDAEEKTAIEPGDAIYLTRTVTHKWYYYIPTIGSVASIIAGLASLYYLLFITK